MFVIVRKITCFYTASVKDTTFQSFKYTFVHIKHCHFAYAIYALVDF